MSAISINNLFKRYDDVDILKGVSLTIEKGKIYALMGPNGSGKKTLISIIACTDLPTSGSVEILGLNIAEEPEKIKSLIGYVPQENFSSPLLTGRENLLYFSRLYVLLRN